MNRDEGGEQRWERWDINGNESWEREMKVREMNRDEVNRDYTELRERNRNESLIKLGKRWEKLKEIR